MSTQIGIVIPMRNCLDFTRAMLDTVSTRHPHRVYVIDDHSDAEAKRWLAQEDIVTFTDPPGSTGLAWNWNLGISAALCDGCSHVLVVNNDVLLHPQSIDFMAARLDKGDLVLVTGDDIAPRCKAPEGILDWEPDERREDWHLDFSCFMLGEEAIRRIGWFDESFEGAYFEDNDYYARLVLSGEKAARLYGAPYFHHSMRTVNHNPDIALPVQMQAGRNGERFRQKWGRTPAGSPEEMRQSYYPFPFNRESERGAGTASRRLEQLFRTALADPIQSGEHLDMIYRLASSVNDIIIVGSGHSLTALAYACPKRLSIFGDHRSAADVRLEAAAKMEGVEFTRMDEGMMSDHRSSAELVLLENDSAAGNLMTVGAADVRGEFVIERILGDSARLLVLRGVEVSSWGLDEPGNGDVWSLAACYMRSHPEWHLQTHFADRGGLSVFVR